MRTAGPLLSPDFLRKLEQLRLATRRIFPGRVRGERRSPRRGASVEFADFRNYALGDDLRYLDWNVYARLERLFIKLFVEEEDLHVYLLIDGSESMTFGTPPKFDYARRAAAALAYIALNSLDRVSFGIMGERLRALKPPVRGKGSAIDCFHWLEGQTAEGGTHLAESLREFSLRTRRRGVAIVISDFLDLDHARGLRALVQRRFEITALHLLEPGEIDPALRGDLRLIDSETGTQREVSISRSLLKRYREAYDAFCADLRATCSRYGINYIHVSAVDPFEELILHVLRRRGVLT